MAAGNCPNPKCERRLTSASVEPMTIKSSSRSWKGVQYLCPYCRVILSVGIDQLALKADIVSEVGNAVLFALQRG